MITESFHNYKGWDFRIRAVTNNGIWSDIFRDVPNSTSPNGMKRLYLRQKGWSYMEVDKLIQQTKNFIDNHESILIKSLQTRKEKYKLI